MSIQQKNFNPLTELVASNLLLVLPSWSEITGYSTLGTYSNQKVSKIIRDPLVFLTCAESTFTTKEGTFHCVFGIGYYHVEFEIAQGGIITDERPLTGLILSDFVYDLIARSDHVTLEDNPSVTVAEKVIR